MNKEQIWYKAKLLPPAQSIFTEGFYPEPKKGTQTVYFTQVDLTPNNRRVLVASRLAENSFRMLTLELARHCLDPLQQASKTEIERLNQITELYARNI